MIRGSVASAALVMLVGASAHSAADDSGIDALMLSPGGATDPAGAASVEQFTDDRGAGAAPGLAPGADDHPDFIWLPAGSGRGLSLTGGAAPQAADDRFDGKCLIQGSSHRYSK